MVPHLQHIGPDAGPGVQQVVLRFLLHVSGEQKGLSAAVCPEHQRGVVEIRVVLLGSQHREHRVAQRQGVPRDGNGDGQPLLIDIIQKIIEGLGCVVIGGGIDRFRGEHRQCRGKAAHVVGMGVGADHGLQPLYPQVLQQGHQPVAHFRQSAVDQQVFSAGTQEGAVPLPDVQKPDREPGLRFGGRGRGDGGGHGRPSLRPAPDKEQQKKKKSGNPQESLHKIT